MNFNNKYEFLEQLHIFALAHVLKRPIIIYADWRQRDRDGMEIGMWMDRDRMDGIYLPLLYDPPPNSDDGKEIISVTITTVTTSSPPPSSGSSTTTTTISSNSSTTTITSSPASLTTATTTTTSPTDTL